MSENGQGQFLPMPALCPDCGTQSPAQVRLKNCGRWCPRCGRLYRMGGPTKPPGKLESTILSIHVYPKRAK